MMAAEGAIKRALSTEAVKRLSALETTVGKANLMLQCYISRHRFTSFTLIPERWFPPLLDQIFSYLKTGVLIQHDDFCNCCRAYYGDTVRR